MQTQNLQNLKINKLTQEQYDAAMQSGAINPNEIYMTPEEQLDLSDVYTKEEVDQKIEAIPEPDLSEYYTKEEVDAAFSLKPTDVSVTLLASGWTGDAAPYIQDVAVEGITSATKGKFFLSDNNSDEVYKMAGYANIRSYSQGTNTMTVKALGIKPTSNIEIIVRMEG